MTTADGSPVPHRPDWPWRPAPELDPQGLIGPRTLPPIARDRLNLHHAVAVLLQNEAA